MRPLRIAGGAVGAEMPRLEQEAVHAANAIAAKPRRVRTVTDASLSQKCCFEKANDSLSRSRHYASGSTSTGSPLFPAFSRVLPSKPVKLRLALKMQSALSCAFHDVP
jgi:hypothetical protein